VHFTYGTSPEDLSQGDVLKRTEALETLLSEVHPHYRKNDYRFFLVLTQTCDLVRRDGKPCSARYISIASVRSVDTVLQRQLRAHQDDFEATYNVCSMNHRERFLQFVKRLLNNNEDEYFYLRQEAAAGFPEDMCAFLRESIPLRARQHYQTLLDARILSLDSTFQAKLGWLVGHIYSRVGTDDWTPKTLDAQGFDKMANKITNEMCQWIDDRNLRAARKNMPDGLTEAEIRDRIRKAKASSKRVEVLTRVCAVIAERYPEQNPTLKNLYQTLASDNDLKGILPS
jgi:hypothetical protein